MSDEDAAERFEKTKSTDPFPEIEPALLNTADVLDYIEATGMIYPFEVDPERPEKVLKPASCAIPVGGCRCRHPRAYISGRLLREWGYE